MALVGSSTIDTVFSENNEEHTFQIPPITKITAFAGYSDTTGGGTFTKQFRYTNDGVNWSEWANVTGIAGLTPDSDVPYLFELKYKITAGAPKTVTEFYVDITQNNALDHTQPELLIFDNIFDSIDYSNPDFVFWCNNVKDKLVKEGIIPEYVVRSEDYEAFWESVTCFFALFYAFTKKEFADIYTNKDNLMEYLRQRGMFFCGDEDLATIQGLANEFYKEISKRGTMEVEGELKRILCASVTDWVKIIFIDREDTGWNIDNTSPCLTGFYGVAGANLMTRKGPSVVDTTDYELLDAGATAFSVATITDYDGEDVDALVIDMTADALNAISGISLTSGDPNWDTKKILIDWTQSYVIEFWAFVPNANVIPNTRIELTVTDDANNDLLLQSFYDPVFANQNYFHDGGLYGTHLQTIYYKDKYYKFRVFVYGKDLDASIPDCEILSETYENFNLQFDGGLAEAKYIYPIITFKKTGGGVGNATLIKIWDIRVAPAFSGNSVSPQSGEIDFSIGGMITNAPLIYNFLNNNGSYTEIEINKIVRRYLFPINVDFLNEFI